MKARRVLEVVAGLLIGKLLLSLAIQVWPVITPPALRFILTSRWRRWYRDPRRTLAPLELRPGMRVLELGPGPGLFTAEASRRLGDHGLLLCADVQRGMLRPLHRSVRQAGLRNVLIQGAAAEHLPLRDGSLDAAFAIAVLPMVADKAGALRELRRVLRPGGLLAVSEDLVEPEYVPAALTRRWCQRAGFVLVRQIRTPLCYTLIFISRGPAGEESHLSRSTRSI